MLTMHVYRFDLMHVATLVLPLKYYCSKYNKLNELHYVRSTFLVDCDVRWISFSVIRICEKIFYLLKS
jgi:hypothetical protein